MKKNSFAITTMLLAVFATATLQAQSGKNEIAFVGQKQTEAGNKINFSSTKAAKNFHKEFRHVTDEAWQRSEDGFIATFKANGISTRVDYSKKGNWIATFRYYSEDLLPKDVRHIVKSEYYDYGITNIVELTVGQNTAYLITIEDKTSIKQVKVVDREMETTAEYKKSE
jgi:hypothetical protein